jgi:hypothetical protein
MREIKCKYCGTIQFKYDRDGKYFCNRQCYMEWKRLNPNKKPYKNKILVSGYYYIYKPNHPSAIKGNRYVAEHRLIVEEKLDRYLTDLEVAHHINGNTLDNDPINIEVMIVSNHNSLTANSRGRHINGKFTAKI